VSAAALRAQLEGSTVVSTGRKGKHLWLTLEGGPGGGRHDLLLHLGMTGGIAVRGVGAARYKSVASDESGSWPPRFCKFALELSDGGALAFTDSRRFARVRLERGGALASAALAKLAPDALEALPPLPEFADALRRRRTALKALLLDQQALVSGVGNWVADEVLYQARLHPEQRSDQLSAAGAAALHKALRDVLRVAVDAEADDARYPPLWLFHSRWSGRKASYVGGRPLAFVTVGGRTSAYVPELQKLEAGGGGGGGGEAAAAASAEPTGKAKAARGREKAAPTSPSDASSSGGEEAAAPPPVKRGKAAARGVASVRAMPRRNLPLSFSHARRRRQLRPMRTH